MFYLFSISYKLQRSSQEAQWEMLKAWNEKEQDFEGDTSEEQLDHQRDQKKLSGAKTAGMSTGHESMNPPRLEMAHKS